MVKKLVIVIGIAVCFISGCVPRPTEVPPAVPSGEVPGGGTTGAPAATAVKWSGWGEVSGGGTTDAALAGVVFNNKLCLFGKGINDKRIYVDKCDADFAQPAKMVANRARKMTAIIVILSMKNIT